MEVTKEQFKAKVLEVMAARKAFCDEVDELKEMRNKIESTGFIEELEQMRYAGADDLKKAADIIEQLAMWNE